MTSQQEVERVLNLRLFNALLISTFAGNLSE